MFPTLFSVIFLFIILLLFAINNWTPQTVIKAHTTHKQSIQQYRDPLLVATGVALTLAHNNRWRLTKNPLQSHHKTHQITPNNSFVSIKFGTAKIH